ncbi:MAG: hypothetical protein WC394_01325, partial [Candidatus Omnitrophota bacterium]
MVFVMPLPSFSLNLAFTFSLSALKTFAECFGLRLALGRPYNSPAFVRRNSSHSFAESFPMRLQQKRKSLWRSYPETAWSFCDYHSKGEEMKKLIYLFALLILLSGCATTRRYSALLDTWIGSNEESLIASWGAPQNVYYMSNG